MRTRLLFTNDQIKRLANILDNVGQVLLASVVIPAILGTPVDNVSSKNVSISRITGNLFCLVDIAKARKDFIMNIAATNTLLLVYIFILLFATAVAVMAHVGR